METYKIQWVQNFENEVTLGDLMEISMQWEYTGVYYSGVIEIEFNKSFKAKDLKELVPKLREIFPDEAIPNVFTIFDSTGKKVMTEENL